MIQQMADLNDKMVVLTSRVEEQNNHISIMQSDIHRMVDLLTDMVEIFKSEESAKADPTEKKTEEVDPAAPVDPVRVDLTEKSDDEDDDVKKDYSDAEEDDSDEKVSTDEEDRD